MSWIQCPGFRERFMRECWKAFPHTVTGQIRDVRVELEEVTLTLKTVIVFDNGYCHKFDIDARPLLALLRADVKTCH